MANAMSIELSETIINNTYNSNFELFPYHDVVDRAKLNNLVNLMEENGWDGVPLVQYGGQLLTGSHRYAAAKKAGIDLRVVDLTDVFCLETEEIDDLIADSDNWVVEVTYLAISDNKELAEILGMDAH
jgi:hypothetical protein